jgi:hypothetical protein
MNKIEGSRGMLAASKCRKAFVVMPHWPLDIPIPSQFLRSHVAKNIKISPHFCPFFDTNYCLALTQDSCVSDIYGFEDSQVHNFGRPEWGMGHWYRRQILCQRPWLHRGLSTVIKHFFFVVFFIENN